MSIVSEQRLLSQRIVANAAESARGSRAASTRLQAFEERFLETLDLLRNGNPATGLPPIPAELLPPLVAVEKSWQAGRVNIDTILGGRDSIISVNRFVDGLHDLTPKLSAISEEVVNILVSKKAKQDLIYLSTRQLMLVQRIENNLNNIVAGQKDVATAADFFGQDVALFGQVLEGMLKGSKSLNIKVVKNPTIRKKLTEVETLFAEIHQNMGGILELSPLLFSVNEAAGKAEYFSADLLASTTRLEQGFVHYSRRLDVLFFQGVVAGLLAVATLLGLGYFLVREARQRLAETTEQGRRNQRAILRLLDELTNLAEGDLTTHATVTEDITGAIADSVNYAIDALRSLVTTINQTAGEVASAAGTTQAIAIDLKDASAHQASEVATASHSIGEMAAAMDKVSKNALGSARVAMSSVDMASKGASTVRLSIEGMDTIREQIQETSKRIKRLGESSQEIGDITGLITEIADQTNILALNAAIQASTAGEAGRGFAVVADEVQRLAERTSAASKQVEVLVRTIQADTSEAASSMEQSTAGVVRGANLAENAGEALIAIESGSKKLASLIQNISKEASQQAQAATTISNTVDVIQDITAQTSGSISKTASSIGELTLLANSLREKVKGFKLPEIDQAEMDTVILRNKDLLG
ncbi:MAG: methyl-accepting chemotaxis protein [Gammaproteobacteria bacterium]|nr:methyl-accepting chemotaxis protein [Gammaproteobacteria bacterium]